MLLCAENVDVDQVDCQAVRGLAAVLSKTDRWNITTTSLQISKVQLDLSCCSSTGLPRTVPLHCGVRDKLRDFAENRNHPCEAHQDRQPYFKSHVPTRLYFSISLATLRHTTEAMPGASSIARHATIGGKGYLGPFFPHEIIHAIVDDSSKGCPNGLASDKYL